MAESRLWVVLEKLSIVSTIGIAALVAWTFLRGQAVEPGPGLPPTPLELGDTHIEGDQDAPVVLLVFSDFECPACGRFASDVLPRLRERYVSSGRIQLAFRHFPLPIHAKAKAAGAFAECAGRQAKFSPVHDELFRLGSRFNEGEFLRVAYATGLDAEQLTTCQSERWPLENVERDLAYGLSLGVEATPTFFIGRLVDGRKMKVANKMVGARSFETFEFALDAVR